MGTGLNNARNYGKTPPRKDLPKSRATISNVTAISLRRYLKKIGLDDASIFRAAGLKSNIFREKYAQFPIEKMAAALHISARLKEDPYFGLHFGEWYTSPFLYPCNYAVNSAPDLRNALNALRDHRNLVAQMPTHITENSAFAEMSWDIELSSAHPRQIMDFKAMRTLKHIQQTTGPEWRPLRVNLAYEKPENLDEHSRLLGSNVNFDQPVSSFRIDPAAMDMPMPDADPDIYHMACVSLKNPFPGEQDNMDPINQFRQYIRAQLGRNSVTMTSASKHMRMTPQQLRRRLKKRGTCFQCILEEARKANAAHYLFETDTRFSEITYLLGFTDQSTFSRAVKRWFGATPREVRRNFHQ